MEQHSLRGVIAYDPVSEEILDVHFGRVPRPQPGMADELAASCRRLLPSHAANARLLEVGPDDMKPGSRYRIDIASGKLILAGPHESGFAASAGDARPPRSA